jgi:hypothetical protein
MTPYASSTAGTRFEREVIAPRMGDIGGTISVQSISVNPGIRFEQRRRPCPPRWSSGGGGRYVDCCHQSTCWS